MGNSTWAEGLKETGKRTVDTHSELVARSHNTLLRKIHNENGVIRYL